MGNGHSTNILRMSYLQIIHNIRNGDKCEKKETVSLCINKCESKHYYTSIYISKTLEEWMFLYTLISSIYGVSIKRYSALKSVLKYITHGSTDTVRVSYGYSI